MVLEYRFQLGLIGTKAAIIARAWSTARVIGTFDLRDDFEFNRGDDMVGKVTIQLNRGDEPLVVMSDDIKLRVKKWKYKSVIEGP